MDPIANFAAAVDEGRKVLGAVSADQWSVQSPCAEWDVKGVVNHMVGGLQMVSAALAGTEFAHAEDYTGEDPAASYNAAADAAVAALQADPSVLGRTVKMPFGEMPGGMVAGIFTNDIFLHAWDVAKATGQSTDLNPALAAGLDAGLRQSLSPEWRRPGMFGEEQQAGESATAADRLAAFSGRMV